MHPSRRKFRVSHGNSSLWVSPYKGGRRFRWREHPERTDEPLQEIFRATKAKAEAAAEACLSKLPEALDLSLLSPGRRAWLEAVHRSVPEHDQATLLAFIEARKKSALLSSSVERFLAFKTPLGKAESAHMGQVARDLRDLAAAFPKALVTDVTLAQLEKWWNDRTGTAGDHRRKGIRGNLVMFWKWARKDGIAGNDVDTVASRLPTVEAGAGNLQILELEELEYLLSIVDAEFFPLIVPGAFQGIRPEEIAPKKGSPKPRLRWETIDWGFNSMVVPADVSKTRKKVGRARKFPLRPVTRTWLEAYGVEPTWRGEICKRNPGEVYLKRERLTSLWGRLLNGKFSGNFSGWPQDSLRKSFASYRIATVRSTAQVSLEMGNSDEMLHGFYNNLRTHAEGEAWFDFLPAKAKVIAPYLDLEKLPKNSPNFESSAQSNPSKARA